jgi:hypothetical protein
MRTKIFLFLLLVSSLGSVSQPQDHIILPSFKVNGDNLTLSSFASNYFLKHHLSEFNALCIRSCSFAKFRIDQNGNIFDLKISKNSPETIRNALTKMLVASNGNWNPMKVNGQVVESKYILFSFLYSFQLSCKDYYEAGSNDKIDRDFSNLLMYENGDEDRYSEDCIVLTPLTLSILR